MSQDHPVSAPSGPELPDLPEATVARLPEYLRALHHLSDDASWSTRMCRGAARSIVSQRGTISSASLAKAVGVNSAKLRKDLSYLGSYGTRGVGYDVAQLISQIEHVLGLTQRRAVALVGIGNLGHALAGYAGFASRGFRIVALLDSDRQRIGERVHGLEVRHVDELPEIARRESIAIGVIATPAASAQTVADRLVSAGVTGILNFAPCVLSVPDGVDVRKVDLAVELQILSFHEHRKAALTALPGTGLTALPGGLATDSPPGGVARTEAYGT